MNKVIEEAVKFFLNNPTYTLAGLSAVLAALAGLLFQYLYARHQNARVEKELLEFQFDYENVKNKRRFFGAKYHPPARRL